MTNSHLEISIRGLRCEHCVQSVKAAIDAVAGVADSRVTLDGAMALVDLESGRPSPELVQSAIEDAIKRAGYSVGSSLAPQLVSLGKTADRSAAGDSTRQDYDIRGMHCASCASRVERSLSALPGVSEAHVNLATNQASVVLDRTAVTDEDVITAVERSGYQAMRSARPDAAAESLAAREKEDLAYWRRRFVVATSLLIPLMLVGWFWPESLRPRAGWIQFLLATPIQFYVGWPYFRGAWQRLRHFECNMDTLVAVGTGTAYVAGIAGLLTEASMPAFHDAAMILTFITLGKLLETKAKGRASRAIRALLELSPAKANLTHNGQVTEVLVDDVASGQTILIRPGDKIPLDARVVSGHSAVNEAWLTGEAMAVEKQPDDIVLAGTVNGNGSLTAVVTRSARRTALAQIIELVRKSLESKADVQRMADRVVAWFVPAVIAIAMLTLIAWLLIGDPRTALTCMVSVLIVACPCALGLATPTAVLVSAGRGARQGILIKNAAALEQAGRIDTVVLDKTGTITTGRPEVTDIVPCANVSERQLIEIAAAVEQLSGHPLANAVVAKAHAMGVSVPSADSLEVVAGQGITAVRGGDTIAIGNEQLLAARAVVVSPQDQDRIDHERAAGKIALLVATNRQFLGVILVDDPVAAHSAEAVQGLFDLGLRVVMLSGDKRATALGVAQQVAIDEVIADVRPEQKQQFVSRLQTGQHGVAMVGDGINDAPALAVADLGIALGTGADVAIETADIVLVQRDLRQVVRAVRLARATLRTIRQNLVWAFAYNVTLLPLAAGLIVPIAGRSVLALLPACSAAAMAMSSVSVVTNSLRLGTKRLDR